MFISGYLLGRKYTIFHGIDAVKSFFINRAIRILPLFFLSLLIYLFMGYLSVKTVLLSMTGFSVIIPPQPPTLCFHDHIILLSFPHHVRTTNILCVYDRRLYYTRGYGRSGGGYGC